MTKRDTPAGVPDASAWTQAVECLPEERADFNAGRIPDRVRALLDARSANDSEYRYLKPFLAGRHPQEPRHQPGRQVWAVLKEYHSGGYTHTENVSIWDDLAAARHEAGRLNARESVLLYYVSNAFTINVPYAY